ncbi:transposase [Streptomyces scabiei]|uniref:transposase n=1 Tax=Streptomyces scabiei TaxID=1930 RepID=UPI000D145948|nr:transposase [Streptomyces scabiei]
MARADGASAAAASRWVRGALRLPLTEQWQRSYAIRAGIEATLSQNVRVHGLRRSRYRGLARTHVQHVLTAMACNVARIADWIDTAPRTRRRATYFRTLCSATA